MTANSDSTVKYAVIMLAGGASKRSGNIHKLLKKRGRFTLFEHTQNRLPQSAYASIIVTGKSRNSIRPLIADGYTEVYNPASEHGLATSLSTGIQAAPHACDMAFVCLADMPFIKLSTYTALLSAAAEQPQKSIFIPSFKEKLGNPVLWRRDMFPHLAALSGDKGGKQLFAGFTEKRAVITVQDPGIHIDLDTEDALQHHGFTA